MYIVINMRSKVSPQLLHTIFTSDSQQRMTGDYAEGLQQYSHSLDSVDRITENRQKRVKAARSRILRACVCDQMLTDVLCEGTQLQPGAGQRVCCCSTWMIAGG